MKKIFLALITLLAGIGVTSADCPPAATSSSNVVLTQRVVKVGMLNGVFSVAANTKVGFSNGNLQYQASTNTWRFAEHQWDVLRNGGGNTTYSDRASQALWIDLFGWATSGNKSAGTYYQPYSTSNSSSGYGSSITSGGMWNASYCDWGVVNAGQLGSGWCTLTNTEWQYLLNPDNSNSYRQGNRFAKATVHSMSGVIIFPDGWTQAKSAMAGTLTNINNKHSSYTGNTISDDNWAALEKEGCVFLPASGFRDQYSWNSGNRADGCYWSSNSYSNTQAYCFRWSNDNYGFYPQQIMDRYYGMCVRLVQVLP